MIYSVLRWIAGIALHWFYGDIRVVGKEKIPRNVPLLIAVNHPNALIDALVVGWLMPRRVVMTAKATLLNNPFIAALFRLVGVVPLRRTSDEKRHQAGEPSNPARNSAAFREMLEVLSRRGAVLIFPEGTSHSNKHLAPLKSGLARVALQARDNAHIKSVQIIPIGLLFENKSVPGSTVGVRVGDPIDVDSWPSGSDHADLTAHLAIRLRDVAQIATLPPKTAEAAGSNRLKQAAIAVAAAWGRLTHQAAIRVARRLAVGMSTDADQPAMFTVIIGVALVLVTYAIHLAVIGALAHSFWITAVYLVALIAGAYWAAFEPHVRS